MLNHNHSPMMLLTINLECRLISSLFYVSQPVLPAENVLTDMVKTPAGSTRTRIDAAQLSIWKVKKCDTIITGRFQLTATVIAYS